MVAGDAESLETKRSIHPEELQLNRSFASFDWLNGVLWDNEPIPTRLEKKLRALVVDENDTNIILDKFVSEPRTRSGYGRSDKNDNESNRKSSKNTHGIKRGQRVARIVLEGNAWPADKLIDEKYAAELDDKQLGRFHRPVWAFTKEEKGKKFEIKLWNENKNAEQLEKIEHTVGSTNNAMRKSSDLSLRSGNFIMVEHMERFPNCLPNFGMISRLVHFHRLDDEKMTGDRVADSSRAESTFQKRHEEIFGTTQKPEGTFQVLDHKERIPLMGGLDVQSGSTVSILGHRLFNAPVVRIFIVPLTSSR